MCLMTVPTVADTSWFCADWPAPAQVRTAISTRNGGTSCGPYAGNNLALHVGDNPEAVLRNRAHLARQLGQQEWQWLEQVHGTQLVEAGSQAGVPQADGCYTRMLNQVCAVMTADCLPVLLCDPAGRQVAAVHAGWRGLVQGMLPAAVQAFALPPEQLLVYLGPAISQPHYEVGQKLLDQLARHWPDSQWQDALRPSKRAGHHLLDLFHLARLALAGAGVKHIYGGSHCTYADPQHFYSYRRDGVTGRFVSAIWLADQ